MRRQQVPALQATSGRIEHRSRIAPAAKAGPTVAQSVEVAEVGEFLVAAVVAGSGDEFGCAVPGGPVAKEAGAVQQSS